MKKKDVSGQTEKKKEFREIFQLEKPLEKSQFPKSRFLEEHTGRQSEKFKQNQSNFQFQFLNVPLMSKRG